MLGENAIDIICSALSANPQGKTDPVGLSRYINSTLAIDFFEILTIRQIRFTEGAKRKECRLTNTRIIR